MRNALSVDVEGWFQVGAFEGAVDNADLADACKAIDHAAGYACSSRAAPVVHDQYGWPEAPRFPYRPLSDSALVELPMTTVLIGGRQRAVAVLVSPKDAGAAPRSTVS
ncbi:DUF3473 domain-containing protein [Sphingomonas flavalba]|uniref:DUF3473 domain-containing protein n=1 Tax=Sphingomonas flavalba TaxID=2559804 RepID=UPI0039DF3D1F